MDSEREYEVVVYAVGLDDAAEEALFDRVAEAAHALDEQLFCTGGPPRDDDVAQERAAIERVEAVLDELDRDRVLTFWCNRIRAALAPSTPRRAEPGVQDCAVKVWGNSDDEQFPCPRPAALEWLDLTGNWVPICESHAGRGLSADRLRPLRAEPGVQGSGGGEG